MPGTIRTSPALESFGFGRRIVRSHVVVMRNFIYEGVTMKNALFLWMQLLLFIGIPLQASDNNVSAEPRLEVLPSNYIRMVNSHLGSSDGSMKFEGRFIVLGRGIYGHFEAVSYNDSGMVLQSMSSPDRAYRAEHGGRVKSINMPLVAFNNCARVEVRFHEMRLNPDADRHLTGQ
jgi:hypothetical protein